MNQAGRVIVFIAMLGLAVSSFPQETKPDAKEETQTYSGQITKIDRKAQTFTIKGPRPGLTSDQPAPPRGRGAGTAPPVTARRGGRGAAGSARPDMRAYEDIETQITWSEGTEVESMDGKTDGKITVQNLNVGDYVLIDTVKDGKKIRATKIKRTTIAEG